MTEIKNEQLNNDPGSDYAASPAVNLQGLNAEEILSYLVQSGTIDMNGVATQMEQLRRERILENHPYAITESKDGRWRTYIEDETRPRHRRQIVKASEEKLKDFLCDYYEGVITRDGREVTMASILEEWLDYKDLRVKKSTVDRIRRDWKKYLEPAEIISTPITRLTKLDLDIWIHQLIKAERMTPHQYGRVRAILNQELDYAVDKGIIESNPFRAVKVDTRRVLQREHKKPDHTQVYSREELDGLCELAWDEFRRNVYPVHELTPLAVMFMFYTGLRIGEVCAIRYEDIDGNILHVRRMLEYETGEIADGTKGVFGDREVPIVRKAAELIEAAKTRQQEKGMPDDGYIFSMRETPILYTSVSKAFTKYCDKMGTIKKSSHKARKTFVSTLFDAKVNVNTIRQIVGHTDERTTLNNYCYDRRNKDEKFRQIENALT